MNVILSLGSAIALLLALNVAYFIPLGRRSKRWDWLEQVNAWVGNQIVKRLLRRLKPGWYR